MRFLLYIIIALLVIGIMLLHRRYKLKKEEEELRNERVLQDSVMTGTKSMLSTDGEVRPRDRANLHVATSNVASSTASTSTPTSSPTEDWMFPASLAGTASLVGGAAANPDDTNKTKVEGGGGTFDGAGASGDWTHHEANSPPADAPSNDNASSPSSDPSPASDPSPSTYDPSPSSYDSSPSSYGSGSSSSYDSTRYD